MTGPILLCGPDAPREEWLKLRRQGISASDAAAAMGISPKMSPFGLYWSKVEGWELADNTDMEAGRRMEAAIADWAADVIDPHENLVFHPAGLYRSGERPWQLATPDRLIFADEYPGVVEAEIVCCDLHRSGQAPYGGMSPCCDANDCGPCCEECLTCPTQTEQPKPLGVLEVKHPYNWDGFGEEGTNQIPLHYLVQVQQQCDVMGVDEWFLAAYAGHQLRIYRGDQDEADLRVIRYRGEQAWRAIEQRIEPDIDAHPATLAALRELHPNVDDFDVEVDITFAEGYRRARAARKRADQLVDRYENRARRILGSGRRLMCGRKLVASRSIYERSGEDYDIYALDEGRPTVDRLNPGRADSYLRGKN